MGNLLNKGKNEDEKDMAVADMAAAFPPPFYTSTVPGPKLGTI
jgi:hypothetical protein